MTEPRATYQPASFRRIFVDDALRLPGIVEELSQSDAIGVDLEMVQRPNRLPGGYQEWVQVLALIQIASETLSAIIDPLRCRDLSPLRPLMAGPVCKVFLGGGQDAALLERAGIPARTIVDVGEVALAIFGRREDGMAALARRIFGLSLDKTVRRTDWLARPVNPALLTYAHRDAELTLLIYRWFEEQYPEVVALLAREELEPELPPSVPDWLRLAAGRSQVDALPILMERGLDPQRDAERLSQDVREALRNTGAGGSPRQVNRLLRIAGELGLTSLLPDILPFTASPLSVLRAAAARAVGQLAEPESGEAVLEGLRQDPIEDVRRAAEAGLRELRAPRLLAVEEEPNEEESSLDESARTALEGLLRQLEGEG